MEDECDYFPAPASCHGSYDSSLPWYDHIFVQYALVLVAIVLIWFLWRVWEAVWYWKKYGTFSMINPYDLPHEHLKHECSHNTCMSFDTRSTETHDAYFHFCLQNHCAKWQPKYCPNSSVQCMFLCMKAQNYRSGQGLGCHE